MKTSLLRLCAVGLLAATGLVASAPVAHASSRKKHITNLEIWPARRTLIVLPLSVSPDFVAGSSDGSEALGRALVPVVTPQLSTALARTGKFSITRPYKFDPLLRRAIAEQRLTQDDANAFIDNPSLSLAQNVLMQLGLDQPGMVAQLALQSLRVGGTPAEPTVQVTVRGDLYEANGTQPFRTITVTSRPFPGRTPDDRLRDAATQAFTDVANAFVEPPTEFQLPAPTAPAPGLTAGKAPAQTAPIAPGSPPPGDTNAPVSPQKAG